MFRIFLRERMVRFSGSERALSNAPGTLPFTISYRDVSSSFAIPSESAEGYGMRQIMVPVLTLNEVVRTSRAPFPEMVKIDAEGFDLRVIEGSSDLLGKTDIFLLEALIFRSNTDKTKKQLRKSWDNLIETAIDVMSHAGYHIIDITDLKQKPEIRSALALRGSVSSKRIFASGRN
jgi:hypothetical protein